MYESGKSAAEIVEVRGLRQISNAEEIAETVKAVLTSNKEQVASYLGGKDGLSNWFFGQVMRETRGKANPQVVREEMDRQLSRLRDLSNHEVDTR
jgi:aspartyl-tRNA(Asn)/glutamyl-tRNA(Gln) amidotransferase subunit B